MKMLLYGCAGAPVHLRGLHDTPLVRLMLDRVVVTASGLPKTLQVSLRDGSVDADG